MDEKKIELEIVGLSYSQTQTGAYALVLGEKEGKRRLPIIIGNFEAQAIAIEMENMTPQRPLTHDLFKSVADEFDLSLREVVIYNLVEGIFYAKLIIEKDFQTVEVDARSSDAIALAIRFKCPIYAKEFIVSRAGMLLEDEGEEGESDTPEVVQSAEPQNPFSGKSVSELESELDQAINEEDYELASKIRDELNRRS
jgi:bifunctional DNase/RNase